MSLAVGPGMRDKGRYWELPLESYPKMQQGGAVMVGARDKEATGKLVAYLRSPAGKDILKKYGFTLPGE